MNNKWFGMIISAVLLLSVIGPIGASAENDRTLEDESIYDLLVDRFNNGNLDNDDAEKDKENSSFHGGDFAGISSGIDFVKEMGFTMISIGPVFHTALYDGNEVLDYDAFDPHFGTEEEFTQMIKDVHKQDIGVIADFPLNGVSENNVLVKEGILPSIPAETGTVNFDYTDAQVLETMKEKISSFIEMYDLDGIRLTKISELAEADVNEIIAMIKELKPEIYVIANEPSTADFDTAPNLEKMEALREVFVQFDSDSSKLELINDDNDTELIQLDELIGPRFTYDMVELRMFPPTRWNIAATALLSLPGVPIMTYGTEIAVNGKEAPESHPNSNFHTDMELYDHIADLNSLRNQSEAFRNGDFELLHNEDGFLVYKLSSDEETWIVALNNTSNTSNLELSKEVVGDNKRLRGVLDQDMVKQSDDGAYRIVLNREVAEIYIADEDKGFNTPYLVASILIYVVFLTFLYLVWRKGRRTAKENKNK